MKTVATLGDSKKVETFKIKDILKSVGVYKPTSEKNSVILITKHLNLYVEIGKDGSRFEPLDEGAWNSYTFVKSDEPLTITFTNE